MSTDHVDVLIVGAGLSGIGAAAHLVRAARAGDLRPRSFAILERRAASGGTWDLFRYPGVRSDSDMFTLGYKFKPWRGEKALADGPSILDYVRETAREYGVEPHIRYGHQVVAADWDSAARRWRVTSRVDGQVRVVTADFLWSCSGYYDYDAGHRPEFPGEERFGGTFVHPQHWPQDLEVVGRRVVVIGSGATAVTLVPALARSGAAHVTMLQRSPTYILSVPARDPFTRRARRVLGRRASYAVIRLKNITVATALYRLSQRRPEMMRGFIRNANAKMLPEGYPVDTHFKPTYGPWDQRLCLVPDGDLFRAISDGSASVVTGRIKTFTETGIELEPEPGNGLGEERGEVVEADVVVTATGLTLQVFGGARMSRDGVVLEPRDAMAYRGMMLADLPNFAFTIGYTNASWTLKADLVAEYVVRLLAHLDATGKRVVTPRRDPSVTPVPLMDFDAGYVRRAADDLPRQGTVAPWTLKQDFFHDSVSLRRARMEDGVLDWE